MRARYRWSNACIWKQSAWCCERRASTTGHRATNPRPSWSCHWGWFHEISPRSLMTSFRSNLAKGRIGTTQKCPIPWLEILGFFDLSQCTSLHAPMQIGARAVQPFLHRATACPCNTYSHRPLYSRHRQQSAASMWRMRCCLTYNDHESAKKKVQWHTL